jgi:hypothetical protein
MSPTQIIIVVAALVLVAVLIGGWLWWRHRQLQVRFGPEYDRVAAEHDSRLAAERELRARERRHADLRLRPLEPATRRRYAAAWQDIQAGFVETPEVAIDAAQDLVAQLVADLGYPTEDDTEQLEQLSVDHARTLSHYREAREIHMRHQEGGASTEELRQALVHYRALFADLLGEEPVTDRDLAHPNSPPERASDAR